MATDTYRQGMIGDEDIVRISTDKLVRLWAMDEFPWLSLLGPGKPDIGSDKKHYWLNNPEGYVGSLLSAAINGGATTEDITVVTNKFFAAGNIIDIPKTDGVARGRYRIVTKTGTTALNIAALSGNVATHPSGAKVLWGGNYTKYGDVNKNNIRLPNRDWNVMEQVYQAADLDRLSISAKLINEDVVEARLTREAIADYKQQLNLATLVGNLQDPTESATEGYGMMDGVVTIINAHGTAVTDTTLTLANFRSFIAAMKVRGAFPGNVGKIVVNDTFLTTAYGWDDDKDITWRDTDANVLQMVVRGVKLDVIEEPALTYLYGGTAVCLALTMVARGRPLLRLITNTAEGDAEKPREFLAEKFKYTLEIGAFQTVEVGDPYRHGWFEGSGGS